MNGLEIIDEKDENAFKYTDGQINLLEITAYSKTGALVRIFETAHFIE